ncbi:uncharacterized protein N7479_003088 [Penicillium vulpinum]|uniref:uncharacterized protein n=1 Tax=Penicillium vulpinum TaxID=29845 RepID=UPI00254755AF|nr:uncharacterized protein N7479_003088 [Penicillium vulpinum]KAJ5963212.1 hypothetical protein N7479_003088 [Penicillium vulpinum]
MTTYLATPNSHKGPRVAVRATPGQDVAIGSLNNGKDVTGTLVGHVDIKDLEAIIVRSSSFDLQAPEAHIFKVKPEELGTSITERAEKGSKHLD